MVAYVLVAKYAWHLPLYRQAQMLLAQGIDFKRAVLAFWVGYAENRTNSRVNLIPFPDHDDLTM
jgi:transposase